MSVEAMALVLHHSKASGTAKLILLGIANHEGDGGAWPAHATLAKYANVNLRNTRKAITMLVAAGELEVIVQAGGLAHHTDHLRPNLYRVLVRCPAGCDGTSAHRVETPGRMRPPSPVATDPRPLSQETSEPSFEPPTEPSSGHPVDDIGPRSRRDDLRPPEQNPRPKRKPKAKRTLTPEEYQASWRNFLHMDLGDLEDDPDLRNSAFRELITQHGAIEPDRWAQAKIDEGQWDGFCASFELGNNMEPRWATPKSA